jgi:hypothetical protein
VKQKYWQLDTYYLPACQSESESEWKFCQSSNGVFEVCVWSLLSVLNCYICSGMLCFKLVPFYFQELNFLPACGGLPFCMLLMRAFVVYEKGCVHFAKSSWKVTVASFVVIWQNLSNYGLTRLKRFVPTFTDKLCN